jgi:DNA-binding transcriptional ArsR family regulator
MNRVEEYAVGMPEETRMILASLDNPVRQAILMLLSQKGELSFSAIQKELGLGKLTLNFHLKNLFAAALIDHYFKHEFGKQQYSYYSITTLGKRVLSNLEKALVPPSPVQKPPQLQKRS